MPLSGSIGRTPPQWVIPSCRSLSCIRRTVQPAISLTAPNNGDSYMAPATINLAADLTAVNKNVIQYVSFYNGPTLIGSVTATRPYQYLVWGSSGTLQSDGPPWFITPTGGSSQLQTNTVTVIALTGPTITGISGNSLNYSGGAGAQFVLLKADDVTTPLANWTRVATNTTPTTAPSPSRWVRRRGRSIPSRANKGWRLIHGPGLATRPFFIMRNAGGYRPVTWVQAQVSNREIGGEASCLFCLSATCLRAR